MKVLIWIVVILLILGGAWWYFGMQPSVVAPVAPTTTADVNTPPTTTAAPMTATVTYTAQGFSPATVTIAKGGSVTWVNQSGSSMLVASGVHPTHTLYDGTDRTQHCAAGYTGPTPFDQCTPGTSYSFTFDKTGTWKYHNHVKPSDTGTVIVQ